MPTTYSRRRRGSKPERRRALELLATSPDGCSEAIMLAHGFTVDFLADHTHRDDRGGYRDCDPGRDAAHLSGSALGMPAP
jgi:hypothetical protein